MIFWFRGAHGSGIAASLASAMMLIGQLSGCSSKAASKPSFSPPSSKEVQDGVVEVRAASRRFIETRKIALDSAALTIAAPGMVRFKDGALSEIGVPVSGQIRRVHVGLGDRVKAGAPLVTLSSVSAAAARAELQKALVEVRSAEDMVNRQREMAKRGVGIDVEMFAAEARLAGARAELARARESVAHLGGGSGRTVVIRSPMSGVVLKRSVTVGAAVEPGGNPLMQIGDPLSLWVVAEVFGADLPRIVAGSEVEVELSSVGQPIKGEVVRVGAVLSSQVRRGPVYIALQTGAASLRPGMYARARITVGKVEGVVLPVESVLIKGGARHVVYVEREDGTFERRDVQVGDSIDGSVHVTGNLKPGDSVVVKGTLLIDGAAEQLL